MSARAAGIVDNRIKCTMTVVTLGAGVAAPLLAVNLARKYLLIQNIGASNQATVKLDSAPTGAGQGLGLDPASSANGQGGSWEPVMVPGNSIFGYSASGTTLVVIEGVGVL